MLHVITGPMFSGKTRTLLYLVKRAVMFGHGRALLLYPETDTRHPGQSHDGETASVEKRVIPNRATGWSEVFDRQSEAYYDLVAVDEGQFLRPAVAEILLELAVAKRVVVAGLDLDFAGRAFAPMDRLLAAADRVDKLTAVCIACGADATHSRRLTNERAKVVVGAHDTYEARCRACWSKT